MEIVIVGGGKLGAALCRDLANEGHEIVLIDKNLSLIEAFTEEMDIRGVVGNGSAREVQLEADVPASDVFISVTPSDETNLVAGIIANRIGAGFSIARVRSPEYARDLEFFRQELGLDMLINPDKISADEIVRGFDYPSASMIEPFGNGRVTLVKVHVRDGSPIIGRSVASIRAEIPNLLLCVVERGFKGIIPTGSTIIEKDDQVQLTGEPDAIDRFSQLCGHANRKWHSALIVGASRIAFNLVPELLDRNITVKLIESNPEVANRIAIAYPEIEVIVGDGTNQKFLREMRIGNYDVSIALTNIDEENLLLSLFAHQQGVRKTITKVNRVELVKLLDIDSLDLVITPHVSTGDVIIRYIRSHEQSVASALEGYARLSPEGMEASEFVASAEDAITKAPIQNLSTHQGIVIANIMRGDQRIIPSGKDQIQAGDLVLIVSAARRLLQLDDVLAERGR